MSDLVPAFDLPPALLPDLIGLIEAARYRVAVTANRENTLLFYDVGRRVRSEVLHDTRAEYGKQIVATVSQQLTATYGKGLTHSNLVRMMQLAEQFPDRAVVETLAEHVSWSQFVAILPLKNPVEREFYATMCHACRWSVRGLRKEIAGALFTRTALSSNTDALIAQELAALRDEDRWTPNTVFRDPYLLGFLDLADTYSEADLEAAIVREIEAFLLELGDGFAFVARQKRMVIDGRDFALDLLFYHRGLRRLVAVELKIGAFEPGHKGQMELYLRCLDKHERRAGEDSPVGIILCTEAGAEQIALLQLGQADIHVAEYVTAYLSPDVMREKLREAVRRGRAQIAARYPDAGNDAPEANP